jgi:hypothetical protein
VIGPSKSMLQIFGKYNRALFLRAAKLIGEHKIAFSTLKSAFGI